MWRNAPLAARVITIGALALVTVVTLALLAVILGFTYLALRAAG